MWESQKHYWATQIRGVDWRSCQAYNVCVMTPCEGRDRDETHLCGGHSDAPDVPMVECARGRRARWARGRDDGGGGRAVSPRAQRARGGSEVSADPDCQWLH